MIKPGNLSKPALRLVSSGIGALMLAVPMSALSGEFSRIGTSGGQYTFNTCEAPTKPAIALDPKKYGNAAVRDYNIQIDRMNDYLAKVQRYMDCLTVEADRDLQTYYNAVSATLTQHQTQMQDDVDALRQVLSKGPNRKKVKATPAKVPALKGAPEPAIPSQKG